MKKNILLLFFLISAIANAQEPSDSTAYYIQNFQFRKALRVISTQEKTKENRHQQAMCYKALGENKVATAILKNLADEFPEDKQIKIELAQCYERSSKWNDTSNAYANLMAIDTTNLYFSIKKAEAEINRKNYRTGINDLMEVLQKDTLLNAVRLLGKSYETINNLDSAFYYYNMAWTADSTDAFAATNAVNITLKKKEYLASLALSTVYIERDSTDKQMNMLNGYAHYALEDYEGACRILERCYLAGDSSLTVIRSLGMSYFYEKKPEQAYQFLSASHRKDTTNAMVLYNLAVSAGDLQKYGESAKYHQKLLDALIPTNMQLYLNYRGLAIAQEKLEEYDAAVQSYGKALQYANENQKIDLLPAIANIWDQHLNHLEMGLMYYRQYKQYLQLYIKGMKENKFDPAEIKKMEGKQIELNAYVAELDRKSDEKRRLDEGEDAPPPTIRINNILFVLNGEVVDKQPAIKPIYQTVISDFEYDKLSESELSFVQIAKETDKTMIVIMEAPITANPTDQTN